MNNFLNILELIDVMFDCLRDEVWNNKFIKKNLQNLYQTYHNFGEQLADQIKGGRMVCILYRKKPKAPT